MCCSSCGCNLQNFFSIEKFEVEVLLFCTFELLNILSKVLPIKYFINDTTSFFKPLLEWHEHFKSVDCFKSIKIKFVKYKPGIFSDQCRFDCHVDIRYRWEGCYLPSVPSDPWVVNLDINLSFKEFPKKYNRATHLPISKNTWLLLLHVI